MARVKVPCPKCKEKRAMTKHHILPKTHYGERGEHGYVCKYCHREFESILLKFEGKTRQGKRKKLPMYVYRQLWKFYLIN